MKGKIKMTIRNKYAQKIFNYIYRHRDETILIKDIITETGFCKVTVHKYINWLIKRDLIIKNGKKFSVPNVHI